MTVEESTFSLVASAEPIQKTKNQQFKITSVASHFRQTEMKKPKNRWSQPQEAKPLSEAKGCGSALKPLPRTLVPKKGTASSPLLA